MPLTLDGRDPLQKCFEFRLCYIKDETKKYEAKNLIPPKWAKDKDDFVFLGRKGNFTNRGIQFMTERIGKIDEVEDLSQHGLRHMFARAAIDLIGYGLKRDAVSLAALQDLHALKPRRFI